ncbi:MAG TPA: hypothetical protein VLD37_01125 [Candidatus Bilamarchaeum sp.]|nr:hypothetical protein [Candidatus Bilamarchaeum sp.]
MLSKDTPGDLALQARQIARSGMPARAAWGELKSWASDKGPVALRSAAMEFISVYGRNPEAQLLMPEVMRSSSGFSPLPHRQSVFDFRAPLKPELKAARPALNFEPKFTAKAPIDQIQIKTALEMPKRPVMGEPAHFDSSKSPDTYVLSASKGHNIVSSLIHRVRSHASDAVAHLSPRPESSPKAPERKAKKPVRKKKTAVKKHAVKAKKTVRKAKAKTRKSKKRRR